MTEPPGRYQLTLTVDGRRVCDGWWNRQSTAQGKFTDIVGTYGRPGTQVVLIDTEADETLAAWP